MIPTQPCQNVPFHHFLHGNNTFSHPGTPLGTGIPLSIRTRTIGDYPGFLHIPAHSCTNGVYRDLTLLVTVLSPNLRIIGDLTGFLHVSERNNLGSSSN